MADLHLRSSSVDFHTPLESPLRDVLHAASVESGSEMGGGGLLLLPPVPPSRSTSASSPLLSSTSMLSVVSDCDDTPPSRPRLPNEVLRLGFSEVVEQPLVPPRPSRKMMSLAMPDGDGSRYLSQYAPTALSLPHTSSLSFQVTNEDPEPVHVLKKFTLSAEFQQLKDSVSEDDELEKFNSAEVNKKCVLKTFTLTPEFQRLKESASEDEELEKTHLLREEPMGTLQSLAVTPEFQVLRQSSDDADGEGCREFGTKKAILKFEVKKQVTVSPDPPAFLFSESQSKENELSRSICELRVTTPPDPSDFPDIVMHSVSSNEIPDAVDDVKFKNTAKVEEPWGWQKSNTAGQSPRTLPLDVSKTRKPSSQLGQLLEMYKKTRPLGDAEAAPPTPTPRSKRRNLCCVQPPGDSDALPHHEVSKSQSTEKSRERLRQQRADIPYCRVLKLTANEIRRRRSKKGARDGEEEPLSLNTRSHSNDAAQNTSSPPLRQLDFNVHTQDPTSDFEFPCEPYSKRPLERVESLYENRQPLKTMHSFYDNWKEDEKVAEAPVEMDVFGLPIFNPSPALFHDPVPLPPPSMAMVPYSWWPVVETPPAAWPPTSEVCC